MMAHILGTNMITCLHLGPQFAFFFFFFFENEDLTNLSLALLPFSIFLTVIVTFSLKKTVMVTFLIVGR